MADVSYIEYSACVKLAPVEAGIIPPRPGEFVAALLERGLVADALSVQREQYEHGRWCAKHDVQIADCSPAAVVAGEHLAMVEGCEAGGEV